MNETKIHEFSLKFQAALILHIDPLRPDSISPRGRTIEDQDQCLNRRLRVVRCAATEQQLAIAAGIASCNILILYF